MMGSKLEIEPIGLLLESIDHIFGFRYSLTLT